MECGRCGSEGEGKFCSSCGATLVPRECPSCRAETPAGARYCTECGGALRAEAPAPAASGGGRGGRAEGGSDLGWWLAGGLLLAVLVVFSFPVLVGNDDADEPAAGAPPGGDLGPAPQVDLSTMTPREAADRLYDRVMRAASAGDSAEVEDFLPMAIDAYDLARPLDADGYFHLSLLQGMAGRFQEALDTAERVLEDDPDHLLNRAAAGEAALQMGDSLTAREHYAHLLEVFDRELDEGRPEYEEHSPMIPQMREDAEELVGASGDS